MILLVLAIFIFGVASVCASDVNETTIATQEDNQMELTLTEDEIQTNENDNMLTQTEDAEILTSGEGTYSDLRNDINSGGNLTKSHYRYNDGDGDTIEINTPGVINGNGAVIDMAGSNIRAFYITASDVTINNLTIKNANYGGHGSAISFSTSGTVTNCNFTNNTANNGGAIRFSGSGTVSNCNFTDNTANYGGSVFFNLRGNVTNCNFINNTALQSGGAVFFNDEGTVSNCNFTGNTALQSGGAINMASGTVSNCNFTNNSARYGGAVKFKNSGTVSNCNFINNKATQNGGAIFFEQFGKVTNCNFTDNEAYCSGAVFFNNNDGEVTNCNFVDNTATGDGGAISMYSGTVSNCNFTGNTASRNGGAINMGSGSVTNCNFTGNTATGDGGAVYFDETGTVTNCNFTGNNATTGSAIYFYKYFSSDTLTVSNSTFLNNRANAGALDIVKTENNITITFTGQNNLLNAIYSRNDAEVTFTNVTYWGAKRITTVSSTMSGSNRTAGQKITVGVVVNGKIVLNQVNVTNKEGTIVLNINAGDNYYITARHDTDSYYTEAEKTITNNTKFNVNVTSQTTTNKTVNITAKSNIYSEVMPGKLLFILPNGTQIEATYGANGTWWAVHEFDKYDVYQVNATYVGLDNVTINNGTITINKVNSTISLDNIVLDYGESENVTVTTTGATGITAKIGESEANVTGFVISIPVLDAGTYTLTVTTIPDDDYNPVTKEVNITVNKVNSTLTVSDIIFDYSSSGSTVVSLTGADGVNATVVGQPKAVVKVNGTNITVSDLDAGTYTLTVTAIGDKNHNNVTKNATITVNKLKTELTSNAITTTYNVNKDLVITLKDITGKALSGVKVTVDLNGAKTYTTDKNGQVKVSTKGLAPKAYTAKVTFNGDTNYDKSTKDIKVTVKKATPKLTAKKKTFKKSTKTKKYSIVLKDNTGKAIKKAKVTLKVKGKTYKATTNSKGKATFKITKLNKKGTFKATITYKGNKYYNKVSKKANIKVIVTFKTVSKGSKDKATVKEIQRALKNKGYYLTYQGHYLKVDGKFKGCTERSLKEFQKDNGLKVTGKVDEKTAKKLGIL